jgi:hypothetical protein
MRLAYAIGIDGVQYTARIATAEEKDIRIELPRNML